MTDWIIDPATARELAAQYGTPVYVYNESILRRQARSAKQLPAPFGLTVRFAIKALPTRAILKLFAAEGLHFDASSGYEVERMLRAGIAPERISLSTQQLPANFAELAGAGVKMNACSLSQLENYGQALPGTRVGLRFNPGLGSGGTKRTNVGGPASSFGIWKEHVTKAADIVRRHNLVAERIHSHIGSGSDPEVWQRVVGLNLDIVRQFVHVTHLNLGGGYKVARMPNEKSTEMATIGAALRVELEQFAAETGRKLHFEIEPGTFLVANAGAILGRVQDIVDTGNAGYTFYKLDCGMTEVLRPSLYGAQHPIQIIPSGNDPSGALQEVIVVGHCCESGDILTPAPSDPEALAPRQLPVAKIGDLAVIGGSGAYCSAMAAKNYNSFPEVAEIMLRADGSHALIRKGQSLDQMLANEVDL